MPNYNTPAHFKDLTGMTFGNWQVIERAENSKTGLTRWLCKCSCQLQTVKSVESTSLTRGISKSCGCLRKSLLTTHGMHNERIYYIWRSMRNRCYDTSSNRYKYYGGRGIIVCDCIPNFQTFYDYVSKLSNFGEDGYSLDRIDNNGNYCICTNNLRWADRITQANNKRLKIYNSLNTSGYIGVYFREKQNKWEARITINKVCKYIGAYNTAIEAHNARQSYIIEHYPDL